MAKKSEVTVCAEAVKLPYKKISRPMIKKIALQLLERLATGPLACTIILCDNPYIQQVNKTFRKKNRPTDVISFAARESDFPVPGQQMEDIGEVYISMDKAGEQALAFGVSLQDEVKRLVIHGMLHLLGYDHERSKKDEKIMSSLEEELNEAIV